MIHTAGNITADLDLRAEVCVIGSGAGGAVVARELAAAGRDVVLLEQGGHYTAADFTQREDDLMPRLYDGLGQRTTAGHPIALLQGRCVGGSTVHNLCYCFRPPEPILEKWRREDGVRDLSLAQLLPSLARVERMLSVRAIEPQQVNALNAKIRDGCERLGFRGQVARHNRVNCALAGFCLLGCPFDSKQSMLITYVPAAERAGARIFANCCARRIVAGAGRARRVEGDVVDAFSRPRHRFTVRAGVVVLSAGAIGSPQLLLASGLANRSGQVGRNLHLHPSVALSGLYDEDIYGYRGIPQSYYSDQFIDMAKDPDSGYFIMPTYGFPVAMATQLPFFGREHFELMRSFHRMAGILVLMHDRSAGQVRLDTRGRAEITYRVDARERALFLAGMKHCTAILFASGAGEVILPSEPGVRLRPGDDLRVIDERGFAPAAMALTAAHPQGTCKMGEDPARAVVNSYGQTHDVANLFVCDTSVFPSSLGVPPQITTAALADRAARYIEAHWAALQG